MYTREYHIDSYCIEDEIFFFFLYLYHFSISNDRAERNPTNKMITEEPPTVSANTTNPSVIIPTVPPREIIEIDDEEDKKNTNNNNAPTSPLNPSNPPASITTDTTTTTTSDPGAVAPTNPATPSTTSAPSKNDQVMNIYIFVLSKNYHIKSLF